MEPSGCKEFLNLFQDMILFGRKQSLSSPFCRFTHFEKIEKNATGQAIFQIEPKF
jgi:hypothetical protein